MRAKMSTGATERERVEAQLADIDWTRPLTHEERVHAYGLALEREARAILAETEQEPEYGGHGYAAYSWAGIGRGMGPAADINAHSAWTALAESLAAFVG